MGSFCNPFIGASLASDGKTARAFNLNPVTVNGPNLLLSSVPQGHGLRSLSCSTVCVCVKGCLCVFKSINVEDIKHTQMN